MLRVGDDTAWSPARARMPGSGTAPANNSTARLGCVRMTRGVLRVPRVPLGSMYMCARACVFAVCGGAEIGAVTAVWRVGAGRRAGDNDGRIEGVRISAEKK